MTRHFDTLLVAGDAHHRASRKGPLSEPIVRATTFQARSAADHTRLYQTGDTEFYQRFASPTVDATAARIALLEGAEAAVVFGSGMGGISTVLLTLLRSGGHVVVHHQVFAQTQEFLAHLERHFGVEVTSLDTRDAGAVEQALRPNTRLVYIETPTNPRLEIVDIAPLGTLCRARGIPLAVDGTFASPALQSPLTLGASLSIHSGTKFLGGHSDVMCGVVAGSAELMGRIRAMQRLIGTILDPEAAWLLLRGTRTLGVRVERQCATALRIAQFLEQHPAIAEVRYPGLPSHPDHEVACRQMRAGGGMVVFRPHGGAKAARRLVDQLQLIPIATSLGGVESVVELPYDLDFDASVASSGLDSLIRFSIGLEHPDDLIADLSQALASIE